MLSSFTDSEIDKFLILTAAGDVPLRVAPERLCESIEGRKQVPRAPSWPRTAHRAQVVDETPAPHLSVLATRLSYWQAVKNPLLRQSMVEELYI
jgi:hypothetical protein